MVSIAVNGAAGRMGRRLVALCASDERLTLAGAIEHVGHPLLDHDAGQVAGTDPLGVSLTDRLTQRVDVLIDFTTPAAMRACLWACMEGLSTNGESAGSVPGGASGSASGGGGGGMVIGTTGLSDEDHQAIDQAARAIPVLQAPNMSLGVNLLYALAARAAGVLGDDWDTQIVETHHRFKKDAPSGTAIGLAEAICRATGKTYDTDVVHHSHHDDSQHDLYRRGQIGIHALRLGDVVGRHTVSFASLGEELQLTHVATDRDIFARGALRAAAWLAHQPPGRYHISDVLGL